ncbi:MAG TPA: DNA/RNA nuclease SfsA [Planctomycetota bacterium]|nr:DNA/RNA nuclease SfsA [Planctomycetota bacterium]
MELDLIRGTFLRRYKRFLADIELPAGTPGGQRRLVTVHVPNTGSMKTLLTPGMDAWLRPATDPKRKLPFTLVLLGLPAGGLAVVDTNLPNRVVADGIAAGEIPELAGYSSCRREVTYGSRSSRIDLLLESPGRPPCYVEVKNNTMASQATPGRSDFPDAVTERGRKHLAELSDVARGGGRAVQFYLVDRSDCERSGIAAGIDPAYAIAVHEAIAAGVEILCYRAEISPQVISVGRRCDFDSPTIGE